MRPTTSVDAGCLVGLAYELVEPGAKGFRDRDGTVLGVQRVQYAGGCL
jgi:hypothetical protein